MKFSLSLLLIFGLVFVVKAGEVEPPTDNGNGDGGDKGDGDNGDEGSAIIARCFNGAIVNGEGVENITEVDCAFGEAGTQEARACQTKIEAKESGDPDNRYSFYSVVRVCTSQSSCMIQADGNDPKCYPGENGVRQCFFCCRGDLCNSSLEIPEEEE